MKEVLMLSFAVASISLTVTEMHIFAALRIIIEYYSKWLGKLFHCGYCFSHWVTFVICLIYKPRLFISDIEIIDYILTAFVLQWIAAVQWALMSTLLSIKENL